ncbi:MAG TPA: heme-binding protein [Bryobacteraceae bacterium]|nr:heme-binding protein [Bryobacteraceae bacterium]
MKYRVAFRCAVLIAGAVGCGTSLIAQDDDGPDNRSACRNLPSFADLKAALKSVAPGANGGLGNNMWASIVNRDGVVCAVVFTGADRGSQWPGSRVISAQKANTANAFSLPGFALSTANLWAATQPGGSLFGLQESNPVDTGVAYGGNSNNDGQPNDPMVGQKIGGINVFGGGLALYDKTGLLVGGLGVSGDTSCTDHVVAWKTRFALNFDSVPNGVSPTHDDNMINDLAPLLAGHTTAPSAGGFGHPTCDATATTITGNLPKDFPIGPKP